MPEGYSPIAMAAFQAAFGPWMRRRIILRMAGLPRDLPPDIPLLVAANHTSWWDGFALLEIQRLLRPRAPVYTVMLESELSTRPFFRRIGAIGIDAGSVVSLRGAMRRLGRLTRERPDAVILFFPQGRIWPSFRRPLGFRPGLRTFLRALPPTLLLPVGIHLEALTRVKPTLFLNAAQPLEGPAARDMNEIEHAVTGAIDGVLEHLLRFGEDAGSRWPAPYGAVRSNFSCADVQEEE